MHQRWIKWAVAGLAIACFLYAGRGYYDQLYRIRDAHWLGILGIALIHALTLALQGLVLKSGLTAFDQPISDRESFSLSAMSAYTNLLIPRSGVGTVAIYLKRVRRTTMADYGSVVLYSAALFVFACSTVASIAFALDGWLRGEMPPIWLTIGLPLFVTLSGLCIAVRWRAFESYRGLGADFLNSLGRASVRLADSGNVWRMGLLHFVMVFLRAFRLHIAFWALGIDVSFSAVLLASVLGDVAFVIAVTPAALGFREAAITFVAAKLGTTTSLALSTAIFDRLVFSLTVVVLAQVVVALCMRHRSPTAASLKSSDSNQKVMAANK